MVVAVHRKIEDEVSVTGDNAEIGIFHRKLTGATIAKCLKKIVGFFVFTFSIKGATNVFFKIRRFRQL